MSTASYFAGSKLFMAPHNFINDIVFILIEAVEIGWVHRDQPKSVAGRESYFDERFIKANEIGSRY